MWAAPRAHAVLTTTFEWDIPGSVEIFIGGTGEANKVEIPAGATSYEAVLDNTWGSAYIGATEGYIITEAVAPDGTVIPVSSYSHKASVNMAKYDGQTIKANVKKIVYDRQFTVNVINGAKAVSCMLSPTGREVKLSTGVNTIDYSSEFETAVLFTANTAGAVDPYIKNNGEDLNWKDAYGTLKINGNDGYTLTGSDNFEIKYCDKDDVEETKAFVTMVYEGAGKEALSLIINRTGNQTIAYGPIDSFEVGAGHQVRFVVNSFDYNVTVNGVQAAPTEGGLTTTSSIDIPVEGDMTVTVWAEERKYEDVDIALWCNSLDHLEFTTVAGDPIDMSKVRPTGGKMEYTFKNANTQVTEEVTEYAITVSGKDGRCFVNPKYGYWIESSEYYMDRDYITSSMASKNWSLHVLSHRIEADSRMVVYLGTDSDVRLRDRHHTNYPLVKGYNEFMIDPAYCLSFSAQVLSGETYFYDNYVRVSPDQDEQYVTNVNGDTFLQIFSDTPNKRRVSVKYPEQDCSDVEIIVDRFTRLTPANNYIEPFVGAEVSIAPGERQVTVNGEACTLIDGVYTFIADRRTSTYEIEIGTKTSGIADGVVAAPERVTVVTLDGCVILRDASASDLDALPKGLYIVNGKKLMK